MNLFESHFLIPISYYIQHTHIHTYIHSYTHMHMYTDAYSHTPPPPFTPINAYLSFVADMHAIIN